MICYKYLNSIFEERKSFAPTYLLLSTLFFLFYAIPGFLHSDIGEKQNIVSFLGFLPFNFPVHRNILLIGYSLFVSFSLGWVLSSKYRLLFSLLAVISFLITTSLYYESKAAFNHTVILPTQSLIIMFFYQVFYGTKFRLLNASLSPRWLTEVAVFFIVIHYFGAGVLKLYESGLSWANGTSFQLWVYVWGQEVGVLKEVIINNLSLAKAIQLLTLILELLSPILFFRNHVIRVTYFFIFLFFHIFIEYLFDYGFWPNLIILFSALVIPMLEKRYIWVLRESGPHA